MSFQDNAIFWIEVEKIVPNPYQPRREFNEGRLNDLAESIRQYGVLQPLVVTRREVFQDDGTGMSASYELIAGERRLRAARIAGLLQVPALIRDEEQGEQMKLELAIIENLQREDLNVLERARAFRQLVDEFGLSHTAVGKKVGKSREYVSNSIRILALPEDILAALAEGRIAEGHTRPLLMLSDRPEEQQTIFKDIIFNGLKVREAELAARSIAKDRARRVAPQSHPELAELEERIAEAFGTRVQIEPKGEHGGRIHIHFTSPEDIHAILMRMGQENGGDGVHGGANEVTASGVVPSEERPREEPANTQNTTANDNDDGLYAISNFSV